MRFGMRRPSWKKSLAARTTGKHKRLMKRAIEPFYGKRGMGSCTIRSVLSEAPSIGARPFPSSTS